MELADVFPENKYDFRADGQANELSAKAYPSKGKVVKVLRESFAGVTAELAKSGPAPDPSGRNNGSS